MADWETLSKHNETKYVDMESGEFQSNSRTTTLRKKVLIGTSCLLGFALVVGLSVGLTHHDAEVTHHNTVSDENAPSLHMICGGVATTTNAEKLSCYQTTAGSGIKFSSDSANREKASSFCQKQLASEMGVSAAKVKLSESMVLPKSMAAQCSQYISLGKTVPALTRASILNISAVAFSSGVATGFGMMLTNSSATTVDTLSTQLLAWFKSSSVVSKRTTPVVAATTAAALVTALSSVSKEVVAQENNMMTPQSCNKTYGFKSEALTFCQAAMGKNSFTKYLMGLETNGCKSCTASLYASTLCGSILQKTNFTVSTGGLYTSSELYTQCKTFMVNVVGIVRSGGAQHAAAAAAATPTTGRKLLSYDYGDGGASAAGDGATAAGDGATAAGDGATAAGDGASAVNSESKL